MTAGWADEGGRRNSKSMHEVRKLMCDLTIPIPRCCTAEDESVCGNVMRDDQGRIVKERDLDPSVMHREGNA
jgi:hypothetical protein